MANNMTLKTDNGCDRKMLMHAKSDNSDACTHIYCSRATSIGCILRNLSALQFHSLKGVPTTTPYLCDSICWFENDLHYMITNISYIVNMQTTHICVCHCYFIVLGINRICIRN